MKNMKNEQIRGESYNDNSRADDPKSTKTN